MNLIGKLEQEEIERVLAGKTIPTFSPGDTVIVNVNVVAATVGNTEASMRCTLRHGPTRPSRSLENSPKGFACMGNDPP